MKIERKFTKAGKDAYAEVGFRTTVSEIRNPDGKVVFKNDSVEVPADWSQVASDVLAQKYFRKAGVPARLKKVREKGVPEFLWRSVPDEKALADLPEDQRYVGESSGKQVFDRLAGAWAYWGWKGGYFSSETDAQAYYDEMRFMLAEQMAAPNSPQWFNTGLHWAYGIDGPGQGHYYVDHVTGKLTRSNSAYEHPQPHACFIQSVKDDLVSDGGIMDLWVREARLCSNTDPAPAPTSLRSARRTKRCRAAASPQRSDGLSEDRRPGCGRHQVGRHHAPCGQDGDLRHGSPRYRGFHQLEGHRGTESGRSGRGLQDARTAVERDLRRRSGNGTAPARMPSIP